MFFSSMPYESAEYNNLTQFRIYSIYFFGTFMIQSMTAFAQHQQQLDCGQLIWELRSVNSRYLEISFRLPDAFRALEMPLRTALKGKVRRGKLECYLKLQEMNTSPSFHLNQQILDALLNLSHQISERYALANDVTVTGALSWPGVLQTEEVALDRLYDEALHGFNEAVLQLEQFRLREGKDLFTFIGNGVEELKQLLAKSYVLFESLAPENKEKLLARLNALPIEVSAYRLEEELALILTRQDVKEELDRIQTHLAEVLHVLEHETLAGRKLDFLMQELQREANTLSAKSDSIEMTKQAIAMKVCIEQMREQIQNIE
jgi:uncharacterized protein (TIGR00255 family)